MTYTLLSGDDANYAGMASAYRRHLLASGGLPDKAAPSDHIPVYIQALMADQAKSLFGRSTKVFTTLQDVTGWVDCLREQDIGSLVLSLYGFEQGGYSGGKAGSYKLEGGVGGEKELQALYGKLNIPGSGLLLSKEFSRAYENQAKKSGFLYAINRVFTTTPDTGFLFGSRYYLDAAAVSKSVKAYAGLPEYKRNAALPGLGSTLYSNFKEGREMSRAAMLEETKANLASLRESSGILALEAPAAYSLAYADMIYNTDMQHSRYVFETDTVPFAQMVTGGHIPSFSPWQNLSAGGDACRAPDDRLQRLPRLSPHRSVVGGVRPMPYQRRLFLAVRRLSGRNRAGIRRRRSGSARGFGRLGDEPYLPRRRRFRHPVRQRENRHRQLHRYRFLTGRHRRARHAGRLRMTAQERRDPRP